MSKILFYYSDYGANIVRQERNKWGGVGYYRTIKPSQMVKGHEVKVMGIDLIKKGETMEQRWHKVFTEYDVFWTSYFSDPKEASALFYTRDKFNKEGKKKKIVIDCDDNFLDVLPSHPLYDKLKATKRDKAFMSTILTFADVITVSTEPLKQRFIKHFREVYNLEKPIFVIPNLSDKKDWDFKPAKRNPKKFVIGYAASNSHQDDLSMVFPHIQHLMKKYKNVYFESVGTIGKTDLHLFDTFTADEMKRCDILPITWTFDEYPKMLASMKWDVGICPLVDSAFTRCKSSIKWLEYSMAGIPVIASRTYPYFMNIGNRKTIDNGKTGILVKPSEWSEAIEKLILDKNKRKELEVNAFNYVVSNMQYDSEITKTIDKILSL